MNYYGYELICESDLTHHGIKGQRWGVRRFQNEDGSLKNPNRRRYSRFFNDKDTYERIAAIKNSGRMDYMSDRQKRSLAKAEQYWKERSMGKKPTVKRGIIRRQADRYRSYSIKSRAGVMAANSVISQVGGMIIGAAFFKNPKISGGFSATDTILATSATLGINEVQNRVFGHF